MKLKTTVDIVIYPGFKAVEAVGAINVFDYANTRLRQLGCEPKYDLRLVGPRAGAIRSDTLVSLDATHALAGLAPADVVVIVGARDILNVLGASAGAGPRPAGCEPSWACARAASSLPRPACLTAGARPRTGAWRS